MRLHEFPGPRILQEVRAVTDVRSASIFLAIDELSKASSSDVMDRVIHRTLPMYIIALFRDMVEILVGVTE
jgi:hypothetical protein